MLMPGAPQLASRLLTRLEDSPTSRRTATHGLEAHATRRRSRAYNGKNEVMPVKIRIPSPLRTYTNGADVIESTGRSVGEVLGSLTSQAAGIETRLFKGPNQLNRFVNIYLNDEDIRFLKNLDTPVKEGDEVSIIPAIAGG
jgi:molybdopterin synthase sulfur carrier subunit